MKQMIWLVMQLLLSIGEAYLGFVFYDVLTDGDLRKQHRIYLVVWSVVIGVIVHVNRTFSFLSLSMVLIEEFLIWISLLWFRKTEGKVRFNIIFVYGSMCALFQLLFAFVCMCVEPFQDFMWSGDIVDGYQIMSYAGALALTGGVVVLLNRYKREHNLKVEDFKHQFLISGIVGVVFINIYQYQISLYGASRSMVNISSLLLILGIGVLIFSLYIRNQEIQHAYQLTYMKNDLLRKNYQELYQLYQSSMFTYHDMKNHILLLQKYCEEGDHAMAAEYLGRISEPLRGLEQYSWSEEGIVPLVLNTKIAEARAKRIQVTTDVNHVNCERMQEDFCIIVANLMDNAIEACGKIESEDRWIRIVLKQDGNKLLFYIENSIAEKPAMRKGKYLTDKKGLHGFGIESVKAKVKKYGGLAEWNCTEKSFQSTVMFFRT